MPITVELQDMHSYSIIMIVAEYVVVIVFLIDMVESTLGAICVKSLS